MSELYELLRKRKQLRENIQEVKTRVANNQLYEGIKAFYGHLEDWLSDLIEEKIILTSYEDIMICEQSMVPYYTNRLVLKAGRDEIEFIPNVKAAVGTTGKIKMKTKKGNIFLIRDIDGIWKQVISKSPFIAETLTKSYIRDLLKSVLS